MILKLTSHNRSTNSLFLKITHSQEPVICQLDSVRLSTSSGQEKSLRHAKPLRSTRNFGHVHFALQKRKTLDLQNFNRIGKITRLFAIF